MKLRQIISGALAFAITANTISFLNPLSVSAESREAWEGYDFPVVFDTWDGTYDTSWFTENAGTKDDPYIIDSAEAFMGITNKAITANAATNNQITPQTLVLSLDELDYFVTGSRTALSKKITPQDKNAWYTYTWRTPFSYSYNVTYTYDTQDIIMAGEERQHHYVTSVQLNVTINGITKTVDVTDIIRQCVPSPEYNSLLNPLEDTNYSHSSSNISNSGLFNVYTTTSELDSAMSDLKNWTFSAPVNEGNIYAYNETIINDYNIKADAEPFLLIGSVNEFNIAFPSIAAKNSAGDTVTIDASNKDEYYLNVMKATTGASASTGYPDTILTSTHITETEPNLDLAIKTKKHEFADTALDDAVSSGNYSAYTVVSGKELDTMEFIHSETGTTDSFYWQEKDSTLEFDKDPHFYYTTGNTLSGYKETVYLTYSCKVTLTTNQIKMEMTCKDKDGNTIKTWDEIQSFTSVYSGNTYNLYDDFYINCTYNNTTKTVTFDPTLYLAYYNGSRYVTKSINLNNFTDAAFPANEATINDVNGCKIYDENGVEYSYADIASELKFVGKANVFSSTHANIVARNIYLEDTLPVILAGNDNANPTFEGKYFKLTTDIKIEDKIDPIFPYCASGELGTAGLSADFDMNGHVISAPATLFGNITKKGKLHNGVFTTEARKSIDGIVGDNYGTIDNVSFIPYNAFYGEATNSYSSTFVQNNIGTISDVDYTLCDASVFCGMNIGKIDELSVLYAISSAKNTTYSTAFKQVINENVGVLSNVVIDSDSDILDLSISGSKISFSNMIFYNRGIIDGFEVKDFTIANNGSTSFRPIYKTVDGSLFDNVTYAYSDVSSTAKYSILPESSNATHVLYNNLSITGNYNTASITQAGHESSSYRVKFINANIDVTVKNNIWNEILCGTFVDSKIKIASDDNIGENSSNILYCNLINTDMYLPSVTASSGSGVFTAGWLQDSYIYIDKISGVALFNNAFISGAGYCTGARNCVFEINEAVDIGTNFYNDCWLVGSNYTDEISLYDTDLIYHSATGRLPKHGFGGYLKNCRIWMNYSGELKADINNQRNNDKGYYEDCEFYFTFDDSANGEITALLYGAFSAIDTFVYIDEMPDAVCVNDATLTGLSAGLSNTTIIAPKVNVHPEIKHFGILGTLYRYGSYYYDTYAMPSVSDNTNIIAEIIVPDGSVLDSVSGYYMNSYYSHYYPAMSSVYPIIHGINATVNVYDKNGNNADIPVYAIALPSNIDNSRINNIIFRSNTLSPYSALFASYSSDIKELVTSYRGAPLFWNCYMDLPNVDNNGTPSADANYSTAGFFSVCSDSTDITSPVSDSNRVYPSIAHYTGNVAYSRCYIPEGQSAVSEYFSSDNSVMDSWNATDSWLSANIHTSKGTWEDGEHFDFDTLANGITEISVNADSNGELAYMLDKGYAGTRRTYNWSVIEPNTVIYNSFNNEPLYTLPTITWSTTHAIPDRCFAEDINLKPVFKTTVNEAQDGYIKAVGIGGSETTNGNIYVKQGAYVVEEAKPVSDEVALIYATQKLGDAVPVKIPNTPRASAYSLRARSNTTDYDITGYTQQGIDTVLTPVFKTARYISVNITNPENGTVIPSAYVSAEGEKITVSIQSEKGYIVNNIKINGQPLTESFFFMPDEDVLITGECVPFEGGITNFSLFGIAGEIDQIAKTITVNVPKSQYVNNALPVIEYYGDYIVPSVSTRTDFTNPVDYTVYYGDNQSVTYKVTVNQSEYTMKIYDFVINGVHGKIDQANRTISIGLPAETDLRNLVPEDIAYSAESISPAVGEARDFTVDQIYTLYTTGMTPVNYVVSVHSADEDTAKLTKFVVSGYEGVIDEENLTVTLTVPEGLDLTNVVPDLIEYEGKKISPSKVTAVDLNDAEYDITSQSGVVNTYTINVDYISDDEAHIDRFVLVGEEGVIDENEKTITVEISRSVNITGVAPDVIEYTGKSIYPSDEDEQDFTLPVTYTVVAPDNTEVEYDIVIEWLENKADLLEFAILGYEGVIDQDAKTVAVTIPYGIDVTDTPPSKLVVSANANVTPTIIEHQNFTNPVVYTVTSQDGLVTNDYTVNVTIERPSTVAEITEFKIDEYEGVIDQDDGTITVTLPFDYPKDELKVKIPEIVWSGKDIEPDDDAAQDFTLPIEYVVTAEDPDVSKDYDVVIKYEDAPYVPRTDAEIKEFKIDEYPGDIDPEEGTITVTLPFDYPEDELKDKVPEIIWVGEDITPDEDAPQDFTKPVEYTVTAEDPTVTKTYDIIIEYEDPDKVAKITEFKIDEYPGDIDEEDGTITVTLPFDYPEEELKDKVPTIVWTGKDIEPDDDEAQDFTKPVEYVVTAQDPTITKEYDIIVKYEEADTTAKITEFKIDQYPGVIDQDNGIITVTVPYNYPDSSLEDKVPEIKWEGKDITPDENAPQDFTKPVEYTVTAEDPSVTKNYDIVVKHQSKPVTPPALDTTAKIIEFKIDEYPGDIDDDEGTITVKLPFDYPEDELKDKIPEIIWVGKDIEPDDDEAQDFTKPVEYVVTAEDPAVIKEYDIVIEYFDPDDTAEITRFRIDNYEGVINQKDGIIVVTVPYGYPDNELRDKIPYIEWTGKDIEPDENEAQDFTRTVEYTVTAQNPAIKKSYDIIVNHANAPVIPSQPTTPEKDKTAKIIKFYIDEYEAEIDQNKGVITITLPADYPEEELKNKVPTIIWVGKDIDPDDNAAQDFTKSLDYVVTAEDPTVTKKYDIIVKFAPEEVPEDDDDEEIIEEEDDEEIEEDPVIEDDPIDEEDDDDDVEIEKDPDGPVPTGVALSFVPFLTSALAVILTKPREKKEKTK